MTAVRAFARSQAIIPLSLVAWLVYTAVTYPVLFAAFGLLGIAHGAMYALIGLGFGTTYNIGRFINFSHGDVFMVGAVASVWLTSRVLRADSVDTRGILAVAAGVALAALVCAALSCTAERLVFRRLLGAAPFIAVVASVGVALMLQNLGIKWNGSGTRKFDPVVPDIGLYTQLDTVIPHVVGTLVISVPALAVAALVLLRTRFGRAIRAVSDDPDAARLMGINLPRTIVAAFGLAGACAGVAGAVYAQEYHAVSYAIGLKVGLVAYASAIIGGVGRVAGTIAGGLLIGVVESLNAWLPSGLGHRWSQTVIFSVMILMLVYKPQGLLGTKVVERT